MTTETSTVTTTIPVIREAHVNKRKNRYPTRSAARQDPNFRGVTFLLHTQLQGCESQLVISAYFSNINVKTAGSHSQVRNRHSSCGSVTSYHTDCWSGSDEDSQLAYHKNPYISVKTCASCATRRTPLWRDAEDGTPLCNACGIRFKKYKVRCSQCWHIPKKDIKTFPNCPNCGALLRVSVCRRSW
ncbi:GATA-type zinc finger protein 1-like [Ylistrum balloti]|uniref:GATA-type zinc finger protein 1-like n=1 Tax=Ylistrum balloti TaxID=509963 RepID=UPI002905C0E3|nr:GATA-type zinc finger protein 1-like [Ylistrum balloti]